jgi:thiol:disulfide interchange protein
MGTSNLYFLLLIAGVGGLLINFTPCVLPLIPIKIVGLSQAAGNRSRCLALGVMLSLGVVAFWFGLGLAISSISGFNTANQFFQYPAFTIGVGAIICVMAIGMSGLFTIRLPDWIYRINPSQDSIGGSFLFGIMTAVLSTPCTAPFMGAAAAWARNHNHLPGDRLWDGVAISATFSISRPGKAHPALRTGERPDQTSDGLAPAWSRILFPRDGSR